jgi:hypothetical protein
MIKITRIQGHYKIIENNSIIIEKSNLITKNGEEYFLERWINNTNDIINFISVGTGTTPPNKEDINLVNLKSKHTPNKKVDKDNNKIILTTTFTASEINQTTEIGVSTNGTQSRLISRDVHEEISIPLDSTITIIYTFTITTSLIKNDWAQYTNYSNVYTNSEPNIVMGVEELDTGNGYIKEKSINSVNQNNASYYWDKNNNTLYIHTSDENTPSNHTINIKY